jgi:hypothetical protein
LARRQPLDPGGALEFVDRQLIIVKGLKVELLRLAANALRIEQYEQVDRAFAVGG